MDSNEDHSPKGPAHIQLRIWTFGFVETLKLCFLLSELGLEPLDYMGHCFEMVHPYSDGLMTWVCLKIGPCHTPIVFV